VLATGLGKTIIFSELVRQAHEAGRRALVLVHRDELAHQARTKLHSIVPRASIGLVKAEKDQWDRDVVIASVPTLSRPARLARVPTDTFGLGIADECHHAVADSWMRVMEHFSAFSSPDRSMPWAGFTATMTRGDQRVLGDVWPEVVSTFGIDYGIQHGYLVRPEGKRIQVRSLMLDRVRRSRGDFSDGDLGDALQDADAGQVMARAWHEHASGRRTVIFSPTVATALQFAVDFNISGIPTEVITGDTPTEERNAIYERFRTGETIAVSSVMVLTEGWDAPWAEVAFMARPTSLPGLYTQCVGRVLRPFPAGGKTSALILDVVGVSQRCSLASLIDLVGADDDPYGEETESVVRERSDPVESDALLPSPLYDPSAELVVTEIELFQQSESAWLQTTNGLWFLATKANYFFLYPRGDGSFRLGRKPVRAMAAHKAQKLEDDLTLEGGMLWAQTYAAIEDDELMSGRLSSKKASWRRKEPSPRLIEYAASMGVSVNPFENQGQLSDRVTVHRASQILPRPPKNHPLLTVN
jgi:superfamily II DNA or RNA helicase